MGTTTRVRWSVVLPLVMLLVSTLLMLLAEKQQPMLRGKGTGYEVPARVLNSAINGPGFDLTVFVPTPIPRSLDSYLDYDGTRLLGIALFWFLIGWSLDRRRTGQSLGQRRLIPAVMLFTFGALACGICGIGLAEVKLADPTFWTIIAKFPLRTYESMTLAFVVWLIALCIYFSKRASILAWQRAHLRSGSL